MIAVSSNNIDPSTLPRPNKSLKRNWTIGVLIAFIFLIYSAETTGFNIKTVASGLPDFVNLMQEMYPPKWSTFPSLIAPFVETIQIAIIGTFIGSIIAVPISLLAANTVNKNNKLYLFSKFIMNLIRTVPRILYAAVFVAAVGIGPFPGVIALIFFSLAIVAKLTSESLEAINTGPIEAVETTGANKLEVILYAVVPQIAPSFISYSLYVFEVNIRTSTVLGLVGAGGIGQTLMTSLNLFMYQRAATIIVATFAMVIIIDLLSTRLRERLM
uniref:Phosphonate uptake transporter n=1 Tax=uncultured organism TaxID=155900 RepID=M1QBU8_9ZZZZ|nr:phosphonate uptake transporter [uncultured organism]